MNPDPGSTETVVLPARTIRVPASISPQAQRALAAVRPGTSYPPVEDHDAWRKWQQYMDSTVAPMFMSATANLPVTTDTIELNGVTTYVSRPNELEADLRGCALLEIHGGALVVMGGEICKRQGAVAALRMGLNTYSVDYRMPPDHPYPAALDDCLAAYRALLQRHPAERIVVAGSSAGGNLGAALALRARDEGLPLPAGLFLHTPEVDLTESGDTFQTNLGLDTNLTASLMPANLLYAAGHDLSDPYLSPLFGDFTRGFPPTVLTSGTRDLLLSNTVRMHRALRRAGIQAELHVFEAMPHGGFLGAPEDAELDGEARQFLHATLRR
jgi:epsilon-lactone hydrolase